jgi:hypothetical protein
MWCSAGHHSCMWLVNRSKARSGDTLTVISRRTSALVVVIECLLGDRVGFRRTWRTHPPRRAT